jgi:hypothetical protein
MKDILQCRIIPHYSSITAIMAVLAKYAPATEMDGMMQPLRIKPKPTYGSTLKEYLD